MDLLAQLPLECFQSILQTLAHQADVSALATLLRVNKHIASITLPYLYRDLFLRSFHHWKTSEGDSDPPSSVDRLLRMLLSHYVTAALVDDNSIPKVVALALNLTAYRSTIATAPTSPLDYAAQIRCINLQDWAFLNQSVFYLSTLQPDLQEYIDGPEFTVLCPWDQFLPEYERNNDSPIIRQGFLRVLLRRELTWTLANPILEQLQTLVIPVSDINRYLGVLDRLGRLECVRFLVDEVYSCGPGGALRVTEEWSAKAQEREKKSMGSLVRFVESHTQLFKGQLKIATCHSSSIWMWGKQTCPVDVQLKFLQLLPPLHRPKTLDARNAMQFAVHPHTTDLGHVKDISLALPPGPLLDRLRGIRQFLQRCRSVKRLRLTSLGKGTFKWAVEEKRMAMDGMGGNTIINGGQGPPSLLDNDRPACLLYGLVAPVDIWIRDIRDGTTDEVDDIAVAFSQTLTDLRVTSTTLSAMSIPPPLDIPPALGVPPAVHFGRGWVDMPALDRLVLDTGISRMMLDRELLVHCPNLSYASLGDRTFNYRCQDIMPCLPARLCRLVTLQLYGWSSLSFHPDTFYSTSELRTLEVAMRPHFHYVDLQDIHFIPPIEELNQSYNIHNDNNGDESGATGSTATPAILEETPQITRPRWTWDWQLPHLTQLRLSGEFAYLFEFRMLRGCPALDTLHLDMATTGRMHRRTLSMADLVPPSNGNNSSTDSIGDQGDDDDDYSSSHQQPLPPLPTTTPATAAPGRIILPVLTKLQLTGNWIIEDDILFELLAVTFPKMEHLSLQGSTSFALRSLLDVARALPVPWKLLHVIQPAPPRDQWTELGLRVSTEASDERQVLPMQLFFKEGRVCEYVVLQDPGESVVGASEDE
ncbi:hypothetical protein KI688_010378 [Linnemannia hyalina]|uniref:F-box domain-containing protein n=1 Tax=Linnemannia hyalina TaxID=64524 RepID=A0A9P8BV61_9FUNG|nr:hypothetical protein KI688_010378 [Linnemannia hyalina]